MKKVLSVILCLSILLLCTPLVYAESVSEIDVSLNQYVTYANSQIPKLEKLPDITFPAEGVSISQPIEILNDNDDANYAFFLFDQSTCIGELVVSYVEGSFCSSFLYSELSVISDAYANSTPFYLLSVNNRLLMCTETTTEIVVGKTVEYDQYGDIVAQSQSEEVTRDVQKETLVLTLVPPAAEQFSTGIPSSSKTLDVPFVSNESVNEHGICWAASVASIVRYLKGNTTVDALSVYNYIADNTSITPGTNNAVKRALTHYAVRGYSDISNSISYQNIASHIDDGYPIYITVGGTNIGAHSLVICGYLSESDYTDYIQILDSNVSNEKIWLTINRDTCTFNYSSNSGVYTLWYTTVYRSASV